jgi:uncharacterized membrane protein
MGRKVSVVGWIIPSIVYVALLGALGITVKYSLRGLTWQQLLVWTAVGYAVVAAVVLITGSGLRLPSGKPGVMTIVSAFIPPLCIAMLYLAYTHGTAAKVGTLTAAYPFVTVILAAILLSETLTVQTVLGSLLIVGGAIVITV